MSIRFFYGAQQGAALAFQKLEDFPDWENSVYSAAAHTGWTADPGTIDQAGRVLDVSNIKRAVAILKVSGAETYSFRVRFGVTSTNMGGWYTPDGGTYTGESGAKFIGIECEGVEYLTILVDSVSGANTLAVEIAPLQYETA